MSESGNGTAPEGAEASQAEEPRLTCDFCGEEVPQVRRIALDEDYDRLQKPHQVRYACPACSQAKEAERRARAESVPGRD